MRACVSNVCTSRNGLNLEAFSFTVWVVATSRISLKAFSHLYLTTGTKRCKRQTVQMGYTNIGGLHVTACRHRKGLIQEAKLLVVAPPKEVILLVASPDIHRSSETSNELLH